MKLEAMLKKYEKLCCKIVDGDTAVEAKARAMEPEIEKLIERAKTGYGEDFVAPYEKEYKSLQDMIYI